MSNTKKTATTARRRTKKTISCSTPAAPTPQPDYPSVDRITKEYERVARWRDACDARVSGKDAIEAIDACLVPIGDTTDFMLKAARLLLADPEEWSLVEGAELRAFVVEGVYLAKMALDLHDKFNHLRNMAEHAVAMEG